ncbi:MAG TPA: hypothetical protein VGI67_18195 [Thermoleophilaceae bacterium]
MATHERTGTSAEEAQTAIARLLLEKVRQDKYPSTTQMGMLEQILPPEFVREYLNVLLEKVLTERQPSIAMLRRLARIAQQL